MFKNLSDTLAAGLITITIVCFIISRIFKVLIAEQTCSYVIEKFGKYQYTINKPGIHILSPFNVIRTRFEMREIVIEMGYQPIITKDNLCFEIDGIAIIKCIDAYKATYKINKVNDSIVHILHTALREITGSMTLDEVISGRHVIGMTLLENIKDMLLDWGIEVMTIKLKDIKVNNETQQMMSKLVSAKIQAETDKLMADVQAYSLEVKGKSAASAIKQKNIAVAESITNAIVKSKDRGLTDSEIQQLIKAVTIRILAGDVTKLNILDIQNLLNR